MASSEAMTYSANASNITNTTNYPAYYRAAFADEIETFLKIYFAPFLLIFGTIGNILSFIVFYRAPFRKSIASFYFRLLAISDTLALQFGIWSNVVRDISGKDLVPSGDFYCRFKIFNKYFLPQFAVWVLVIMSVERVIGIMFPHKSKHICTRLRAKIAPVFVLVMLLLANVPTLFIFGTVNHNGMVVCGCVDCKSAHLVWPWVDLTLYSLAPFALMIICNSIIIHQVLKSRRVLKIDTKQANVRAMTITLLTVAFVFLLLTLPYVVYSVTHYWHVQTMSVDSKLFYFITSYLRYVNNSINFPLYCLSGRPFRVELRRMCCYCFPRRRAIPTSESNLSTATRNTVLSSTKF